MKAGNQSLGSGAGGSKMSGELIHTFSFLLSVSYVSTWGSWELDLSARGCQKVCVPPEKGEVRAKLSQTKPDRVPVGCFKPLQARGLLPRGTV